MADSYTFAPNSDFDKALDRLCELNQKLDAQTDAMNAFIRSVEARLAEGRVGIEHWHAVQIDRTDLSPNVFSAWRVGWARISGEFGLVAEQRLWDIDRQFDPLENDSTTSEVERDTPEEYCRLLNAPKRIRVAAVTIFPELIKGLTERAKAGLKELSSLRDQLSVDVPF